MIESHFCAALADRVKIHLAPYVNDEEARRIYIVLDKKQVFSVADNSSPEHPDWYSKDGCVYLNSDKADEECVVRLKSYLNYSIEEALGSTDELVRAMAMFDKRVDKRRLYSLMDEMESAPLLVKHFYTIRWQAEGSEKERVTRFEIYGMIIGALVGAAPPLYSWYSWGQYHPALALAWGAPLNSFAFVTGFIGAFIGAIVGNAVRNFRIK
jgi:hypothetical protein